MVPAVGLGCSRLVLSCHLLKFLLTEPSIRSSFSPIWIDSILVGISSWTSEELRLVKFVIPFSTSRVLSVAETG